MFSDFSIFQSYFCLCFVPEIIFMGWGGDECHGKTCLIFHHVWSDDLMTINGSSFWELVKPNNLTACEPGPVAEFQLQTGAMAKNSWHRPRSATGTLPSRYMPRSAKHRPVTKFLALDTLQRFSMVIKLRSRPESREPLKPLLKDERRLWKTWFRLVI